jgi:hypothetical protein
MDAIRFEAQDGSRVCKPHHLPLTIHKRPVELHPPRRHNENLGADIAFEVEVVMIAKVSEWLPLHLREAGWRTAGFGNINDAPACDAHDRPSPGQDVR